MIANSILLTFIFCDFTSALNTTSDLDALWNAFKYTYHKRYDTQDEEIRRRSTWLENLFYIERHNRDFQHGLHTFSLGMNEYSDLGPESNRNLNCGYFDVTESHGHIFSYDNDHFGNLPPEVDWRKRGYVTNVKNQCQCGSCWAFAATGALEGQHFRKTGKLVSLSEQNLVDTGCVYARGGCNGGWMGDAFSYVIKNGGIDTEVSYPYIARPQKCHFLNTSIGSRCSKYAQIPIGREDLLKAAVATQGPVAVLIDAAHKSFMHYKSGIFYEPKCSNKTVDHAVLVVGYGTENHLDYWLVKNSWGVTYGDKGYIKMSRNRNNNCAIATYAIYPLV